MLLSCSATYLPRVTSPAGLDAGPAPSRHPGRTSAARPGREAWGRWVSSAGTVPVQVLLVAAVAVLARLPFVATALSSDEGGFLMVAAQWRPGTSLYGDYWVDRPPLIIGLFHLADLAGGGPVALRLLGALGVAAAVAAAAWTGNLVARTVGAADSGRHRASLCAAVTAAVFMVSPLVGAMEVDGELLAVPFVLAGIAAALEGYLQDGRAGLAWWGGAGALAVAAVAVKQDMLEVGVAAVVLLAATVGARSWRDRRSRRPRWRPWGCWCSGRLPGGPIRSRSGTRW